MTPPAKWQRWSDDDERELLYRLDSGEEPLDIAKKINRAIGAVYLRLQRLGRLQIIRKEPQRLAGPEVIADLLKKLGRMGASSDPGHGSGT